MDEITGICLAHSGIKTSVEDIKEEQKEIWGAINSIRSEVKKLSWTVGLIVGIGIAAQTIIVKFL